MTAALARREIKLGLVGEQEEAHLVAAAGGGAGERRGDLGGGFAFAAPHGTESAGGRDIQRENDAEFAFLAIPFNERTAYAVGDVPVYVADVVARNVIAQFLEIHAAPLEMAQVRADHHVVDEAVGADLDAADGFEDFLEGHKTGLRSDGENIFNTG